MPLDFTDRAILTMMARFKIKNGITFEQFIEEVKKIWQEEITKKEITNKK
jgi:hypothetical protein